VRVRRRCRGGEDRLDEEVAVERVRLVQRDAGPVVEKCHAAELGAPRVHDEPLENKEYEEVSVFPRAFLLCLGPRL